MLLCCCIKRKKKYKQSHQDATRLEEGCSQKTLKTSLCALVSYPRYTMTKDKSLKITSFTNCKVIVAFAIPAHLHKLIQQSTCLQLNFAWIDRIIFILPSLWLWSDPATRSYVSYKWRRRWVAYRLCREPERSYAWSECYCDGKQEEVCKNKTDKLQSAHMELHPWTRRSHFCEDRPEHPDEPA